MKRQEWGGAEEKYTQMSVITEKKERESSFWVIIFCLIFQRLMNEINPVPWSDRFSNDVCAFDCRIR